MGVREASLPAAYLSPAGRTLGSGPATALGAVEAHAEAEQRVQAKRDRGFDSQVRRASGLVCVGCLSGDSRPAGSERDAD